MSEISSGLIQITDEIESIIGDNPVSSVAIGTGLGLAAGAVGGSIYGARSRRKNRKKKMRMRKSTQHRRSKGIKRRLTPHTAGKRRDTSHRRIRQTKNGQPYVIMANGRARFIKKSSARNSRKRRGGRY